ncbi:MAG: excinuclease ABC subunit UvrC [Candidatus Omnitrophica bacterium]|jgi:excinuclease ABC subunit C|nr:excinuclease ABC subunit UvrC [Candidatus Omnitrophota bacterium]
MDEALKKKVISLPDAPGVYIFKDKDKKIIYIGKAKSLKKRVYSYFSKQLSSKIQALVSRVEDLDYISAPTESKANILEAKLIRDKQPRYNTDLKDDKSFPFIKITSEDFPIVSICRRRQIKKNDNSLYFGPFTDAQSLRVTLKLVRRLFGFRSCRKMPKAPCLYARLKMCPAVCVGAMDRDEYKKIIKEIILFLEGKFEELIQELSLKMHKKSVKREFEEAAGLRDQIQALSVMRQASPFSNDDALEQLRKALNLEKVPLRIEAFDISNIAGQQACASMVSFYNGHPDKNNYRRFRIKTVSGVNDYGMMAEVVRRRYSYLVSNNLALPDLVLIDGGKGHLETALREIRKLGLSIALCSIAKKRENLYIVNRAFPVRFKEGSKALNLIRHIRDQAHRFAITYHRLLRKKNLHNK